MTKRGQATGQVTTNDQATTTDETTLSSPTRLLFITILPTDTQTTNTVIAHPPRTGSHRTWSTTTVHSAPPLKDKERDKRILRKSVSYLPQAAGYSPVPLTYGSSTYVNSELHSAPEHIDSLIPSLIWNP